MSYIGYEIKKQNLWSVLILSSMLIFLSAHFIYYLNITIHDFPNHLLTTIFCITEIIILILAIFQNKKERILSFLISITSIIIFSILTFNNNINYKTTINLEEYGIIIDNTWTITTTNNNISTAKINNNKIEIHFKKKDANTIILKDNKGTTYKFLISADKNKNIDIVEDN